jgi:hypothetical protein
LKPPAKYNTIIEDRIKSNSMINHYPMKGSVICMKKDIQKNLKKKKLKEMKKRKSVRGNLVTRVTVPATTTSKRSFKYFSIEDSHTSATPADLHMPSTMAGSTKRIYDKIMNSNATLTNKLKGTPTSIKKTRESGIK